MLVLCLTASVWVRRLGASARNYAAGTCNKDESVRRTKELHIIDAIVPESGRVTHTVLVVGWTRYPLPNTDPCDRRKSGKRYQTI
ncbi:hypothetical protein F4821DRAFT_141448 [Hypoxylon rubiginosum]|uniref:Uncharacterized protein n=1 Tax=Hypoxylon rubiginosum TaxID=110542 RepID=A0ACC0CZL8_9PEZI|nr:hypothetical protein F4821DRAFT_141448 [Hypoxylon rubiginosum]